jgi:hypothetical protein
MQLYIHFGIYKAASSYIQYICCNAKDSLRKKSIHFPDSTEDHKMKTGLISRGNADNLRIAIKNNNINEISNILKQWKLEAKKNRCEILLISGENFVHQLANKDQINFIIDSAKKSGFQEIKAMGFFRDLTDHALSTYKHRAKSGRIPDYKHWVSCVYETPKLFENLSQVISFSTEIEWTLRKFQKDSDFLKQAFFKDWLGIEVSNFQTRPNVNESVIFFKVKVMNHLCKLYPNVTDYFVNDLKALSSSIKAKDKSLQDYIFNVFSKELVHRKKSINQINTFFQKEEYLEIGEFKNFNPASKEPSLELSEEQVIVLINRMHFFKTFTGKKILIRRKLKKHLFKIIGRKS